MIFLSKKKRPKKTSHNFRQQIYVDISSEIFFKFKFTKNRKESQQKPKRSWSDETKNRFLVTTATAAEKKFTEKNDSPESSVQRTTDRNFSLKSSVRVAAVFRLTTVIMFRR
jgi:hypothetical protein